MKSFESLGLATLALVTLSAIALAQPRRPFTPISLFQNPSALAQSSSDTSSTPILRWRGLTNQPTFLLYGACNPLQLTDGTVLVHDCGSQDWWRLTPDNKGSYVNGAWSQIASLPAGYAPLYHASAVLSDGRVIVEGGEYNFFNPVWTNLGAIYDPLTDEWTSVSPPDGWSSIGDAPSVVLANGTFMLGDCCSAQEALFDAKTLTWTPTGAGKFDWNAEEGWSLLPNGKVLNVDTYINRYNPNGRDSEIYDPVTGRWSRAGDTVVQLWDSAAACGGESYASFELGPSLLTPAGLVFVFGSNSCGAGHTSIYDYRTGKWTPGPDFPDSLDIADGPAALLPSGSVLCAASPGIYESPVSFFEYDGINFTPVATPPGSFAGSSSYYINLLILPTGQILATNLFSDDIEVYTPAGGPDKARSPVIHQAPATLTRGESYKISGYDFNGFSQGSAYGDDVQAATNYPLVRITNHLTGHVFYARTHDHTSMAVASSALVSTTFDVPSNIETGSSELVVVANGNPSAPVTVMVR